MILKCCVYDFLITCEYALSLWSNTISPQLEATSPLYCHVKPGDILYLPAFWHHVVASSPSQGTDCHTSPLVSLAINLWFHTNVTKEEAFARPKVHGRDEI